MNTKEVLFSEDLSRCLVKHIIYDISLCIYMCKIYG